ncbi:MAG TPA: aminopeptidase [Gemmatimonadaceae bacterium]|nr:aminopeptidase [Gemmatimonadaceae bacterium]
MPRALSRLPETADTNQASGISLNFVPVRIRKKMFGLGAAVIVLILALSPTGCYLSRGAWEEGKILARRKPIATIVADRRTDPLTRRKLEIVLAARQYAKDSIGLMTEESFTTYSKLDRDTLVLVLSAAYRDRLEPYTWWFPIVGRVPYKGFFDFDEARNAARRFEEDGFDVVLRPSAAFSTLGFFDDPLTSTTLVRDSLDLANTVIHEVTHNTFYAPGQAVFNESFANFVGARGAAAFFRTRGQPAAALRVDAEWADEKLLGDFWTHLARSLDSAYAMHPDSREARIAARDTVYSKARRTLVTEIGPRLMTIGPFYVQRVTLNNAALLARRVYAKDLDLFDAVYEREGHNLRHAIGRVITLARSDKKNPYGALRRWLGYAEVHPIPQVPAVRR